LDRLSQRGSVDADEITSRLQKAFTESLDHQLGGLHDTVKRGFDQIATALEDIATKIDRLAPSTLLFDRVRDLTYGADNDPSAFIPSWREFEERLVHRPALADQVQDALIERRFACVLGKGASGKTTLALLLAFSEPFGPERSYYLDLAGADHSPEAAEPYRAAMQAIACRHGRNALVILDNVHLAEGLAHKLHLAWREEGQPVRLLLQGRFTQRGADWRGRPSPLEELKRTALVLEVMPNDLVGVLQRLIRRVKGNHLLPAIPLAVLDQWLNVFASELIAFSSAARRKLPQIVRAQFELSEADAADYVRDEYLDNAKHPITLAERDNLLAIAACAGPDWELLVPAEGLPFPLESALAVSMGRGLVWKSAHGRFGQFARYRLCHPGMGRLLWAAARPEKSRLDYACELSQRVPFFGFFVVHRLLQPLAGDRDGAKQILVAAFSRPDAFERLIEHGMSLLKLHCQQLLDLKVLSRAKLNQKLAACSNLAQAALATPLGNLADFLEYAKTPMPNVWQALADALADEKNRQRLAEAALATPLDHLASFLEYAKSPMPNVWQTLADALADEKNRQRLAEAALATQLGNLPKFLRYAKTDLRVVWVALANSLAEERSRQTLARVVFATPLHALVAFIRFTGRIARLKPVHDALVKALVEDAALPADKSRLVQAARASSFGSLWGFVRGIRENPQLAILTTAIEKDGLCSAILNSQHRAERPIGAVKPFVRYSTTWYPEEGEDWDGEED